MNQQQGDLFAPKPQPPDEGKYLVLVAHGQEWRAVSRDHRFMDAGSANQWAFTHPYEIMGRQWRVILEDEINK